jgi:shikimate 5-dehydrogenase
MKLFPLWAGALGLKGAVIRGIDLEIHASPKVYRGVVQFIKENELALGALVTTHKIDLYNAARDLFEYLDPNATMFGELSSISKKEGRLEGYAKDPVSSGLAMEAFIPVDYWKNHRGQVFIMGAGGSAIAISSYLLSKDRGDNMPAKLIVSNRSQPRLTEIIKIVKRINPQVPSEFYLTPEATQNDSILRKVPPYSLIVNATGLGKDRPGSPLTNTCDYPQKSLVWELNYRGELDFMHQAIRQKTAKNLQVEDGWIYFIHGWTQVIAEVFHIEITGERFAGIEQIANSLRPGG